MPVSAAVAMLPAAAPAVSFAVEYVDDDGTRIQAPLATCSQVRFESSPPIRATRPFRGQRNFAGLWWMATTESHVGFESWLKRDLLIVLDFDPSVASVSAWPFCLSWTTDDGDCRHSPDYFARRVDGTAVVIDVRLGETHRCDDASVLTAVAADQAGWEYRRIGRSDPVLMANLRWLAGYRHPRCGDATRTAALREAFAVPRPLADGIARVGDPLAIRPAAFHLLWSGGLLADLHAGLLGPGTPVIAAPNRSS
jgi:hypothetical protein